MQYAPAGHSGYKASLLRSHDMKRLYVTRRSSLYARMAPQKVSAIQEATAVQADATAKPSTIPSTRKAWHITKQGDMNSLRLIEEPMPSLQPGEVLVEVKALGLNFADVFCCLGLYKAAPKGDFIPGLEFSGIVLQTAEALNKPTQQAAATTTIHTNTAPQQQQQQYKPGDPVLGVLRFGAFASHVTIPKDYLRPIPQTPKPWSFEEAAGYPVQTLTAAFGLFNCGGYRPGQAVLVHSAAGGVGLQALQILERTGSTVLGLVGSSEKVRMLEKMYGTNNSSRSRPSGNAASLEEKQQSIQEPLQQQQTQQYMEFATRVTNEAAAKQQIADFLQRSGRAGFDVILDSLGPGPYFKPSYDALNPCGRHVIFGAGSLTPKPGFKLTLNPAALLAAPASLWGLVKLVWGWLNRPKLDVINMPGDNKGVIGFNLIWLYDKLDMLAELYDRIDGLGLDAPVVGKVFGFEQLPEALAYLQSGRSVGKVVVAVDSAVEHTHN